MQTTRMVISQSGLFGLGFRTLELRAVDVFLELPSDEYDLVSETTITH